MSALTVPSVDLRSNVFDAPALLPEEVARRARARRITWLIVAITLMSLADLLCTLTYMRTSGMLEANPLARLMLDIGNARQLVLFKVLMMLLSAGTLYLARRRRLTEHCAWACTAMMLGLTVHWIHFNHSISTFTNDMAVLAMSEGEFEPMWVKLD